jgi:predicted Zn-dependent protease
LSLAALLSACADLEHQGQLFTAPIDQANRPTDAGSRIGPPAPQVEDRSAVQHRELVAQFGGEYHAPATENYLNEVLAKLAAASDTPGQQPYRVTILNTPVVNAFALPTGYLYVTRGLLALADDASEAAAVMAHEISHVTLRHSALRAEREREAALISQAATVIQNRQKGDEVRSSQQLSVASFSRQQEIDADLAGVKAIARAGYDPYGAARFLTSLGRSSDLRAALYGRKKRSLDFDINATHPSTPERIARVVAAARQISAPGLGQRDRNGYLAAINGVAFGDDPMEGFVRGRKFTHPRLGFTLTAPEGFLLENSNEAVFGVRHPDNEALRLDNVKAPATGGLEAYVASGWVDGLLPSSVHRIEINGLPAITAIARAGEWNFRLAVIQYGDCFYRMIFAAHDLNAAADKSFLSSIETFRSLSPEESREVRSPRIAIVIAGPGDTVESLSRQMATPNRPQEYFLLLNGLEPGDQLRPGEHYKTVMD